MIDKTQSGSEPGCLFHLKILSFAPVQKKTQPQSYQTEMELATFSKVYNAGVVWKLGVTIAKSKYLCGCNVNDKQCGNSHV